LFGRQIIDRAPNGGSNPVLTFEIAEVLPCFGVARMANFCRETRILAEQTAILRGALWARLGNASLISWDLLLSPDREKL